LKGHSESVSTLQWSPDGLKVATASGDGTVIIWSATNGTILLTLYVSNILVRNVTDVLWSPDGAKVATLNSDGIVDVWSSTSGAKLFTLKGHTLGINTVQWSPDGTKILTASDDKTSNIWSSVDGAKLFTLTGHTSYVLSARWSSDGGRIATASYDETAIVWDATKGTKLFTINGIIGPVRAVEWSPDGSKIATLNFDTVTVWNAITGTKSYVLSGDSQFNLVSLQWSPDGSKILTVSTLGTAVIWLATNGFKQMVLNGNPGGNSGQWSPDGSKVLIGCAGHTAIIWSAETGAKLFTLNGHTKEINTAQWSLDGSKVATASLDKTAKIWDINDTSLQEDVSDAVFSIVAPSPTSQDVDMKQCFVGTSKDSLITTFVQNAGTYPFRVDSIAIVGTDASQFQLVSGMPPYIVGASGTHAVEFRFKPTSVGVKTAQLLVYTQADTLRQTIHGEGIAPTLQVLNDIVDFGRVLVGKQRDTLQTTTIKNIGNAPLPITATRHAGPNDKDFTTLAGGGNFTLQPGEVKTMDLRFTATEIGRISGRLLFDYNGVGSPATVQLFAEGVDIVPSVTSTASVIFDSVCVGKTKTTNVVVTNNGNVPLQLLRAEWITNTGNQFSTTLSPKTLDVDSSLTVSIDYTPNVVGQSVAEVRFIADKDTAISTLSGIGKICTVKSDTARTTVSAINITAQAGEKVNLQLVLKKQSGMQLTGAPTDWYARVHYNSSVLYNTQTNNTCIGTTDSCVVELNGTYNPTQSELISVPCVVTLGNTDNASITIDEFRWTNNSITTEVVTENGTIHVTGVCDEGGVRLFMPSNVSTSLATRPNPAQNTLAIHYGLREPLNVTIELINTTGQVVQTFVQNQQQAKGEYTLNEDISTLGNGVYMLRLVTNKDVLATRVDVVK
ncbi:MAG: choice-of-anchor D domain-containing protein, partial [Candidatus Kapabacteria bacterium]|nr:choice-of-anchor D domain-containing protein [Candidatus Kapabacteria bacterium]